MTPELPHQPASSPTEPAPGALASDAAARAARRAAREPHEGHPHTHAGYGLEARAGIRALEHMTELEGYRIADGGPDIRGWRVVAQADAQAAEVAGTVGAVRDLLVDVGAMRVKYLDVELQGAAAAPTGAAADVPHAAAASRDVHAAHDTHAPQRGRHVLVPIALADFDEQSRAVVLPNVPTAALTCLPEYHREPITREREREVEACFAAFGAIPPR